MILILMELPWEIGRCYSREGRVKSCMVVPGYGG